MTIWRQDAYRQAYRFAAAAHNGQLLPGTELPYVVHVTLVAMEIIAAFQYENDHDAELAVQCALLHDVIEDTATTYNEINEAFGPRVADGVSALSKDGRLDKADQMADSLRRIRTQPREIGMVKMADRITNLHPPFPSHWDRRRIDAYRQEAAAILSALAESSPYLAARMEALIAL
jgi:(p)ppGpp synthase/HD superfamily hydrolase